MARISLRNMDRDPIIRWAEQAPGTQFEGFYRGLRPGKFAELTDLESSDGIVTLPAPTVLARLLKRVKLDAPIAVEYLGCVKSKRTPGHEYHDFDVHVDASDVIAEADDQADASQF